MSKSSEQHLNDQEQLFHMLGGHADEAYVERNGHRLSRVPLSPIQQHIEILTLRDQHEKLALQAAERVITGKDKVFWAEANLHHTTMQLHYENQLLDREIAVS